MTPSETSKATMSQQTFSLVRRFLTSLLRDIFINKLISYTVKAAYFTSLVLMPTSMYPFYELALSSFYSDYPWTLDVDFIDATSFALYYGFGKGLCFAVKLMLWLLPLILYIWFGNFGPERALERLDEILFLLEKLHNIEHLQSPVSFG